MQNLALAVVAGLAASASASAVTLFDNGPLGTGATTGSGVAAPAGFQWSEVPLRTAEPGVSNTVAGFSVHTAGTSAFRLADNFTVGAGGWTVNTVRVFAYQTGSAAGTSPFSGARLQIWNGRPGDVGASVVFGDLTTNVMAATGNTNMYRIFNTTTPPPGTAPGTTRLVRFLDLNVGGLNLAAGTYWIDWTATLATGASAFAPSITIPGQGNRPGDNGRQWNGTAWTDMIDAANPGTGADLVQDLVFSIDGTVIPTPGAVALFGVAGLAGLRRRR